MLTRRHAALLVAVPVALAAAGCGGSSTSSSGSSLRLGYFANVTHAGAVVGVAKGFFQGKLGSTKLSTQTFTSGGPEMSALLAGSLDAAFVGPSSAINAFTKSKGGVVIVAGATSGGASLVVKSSITSAAQLKGQTLADPQSGNTQDVALRSWLSGQGFTEDSTGAGDVTIVSQDNATTLEQFEQGRIAGGWLPEPWASRLVQEGGAHTLVDEKTLWPGGQFATTNLAVSASYLKAHPDQVKALIEGEVQSDAYINSNSADAQTVVNSELKRLTSSTLKQGVISSAFSEITVTEDPLASTAATEEAHAVSDGLVKTSSLNGLYNLTLLDQVLGKTVSDDGLGQ